MGSPLSPQAVPEPRVSILIIAQRGLSMTRACLDSVFATSQSTIPCEIIVIDDASADGTDRYLQSLGKNIRVLQNSSKKSFSQINNLAAKEALGEFLCLLNDDTVVTEGWLEKMLAIQNQDSRVGLVGNRHLDPKTGQIRHAGMVFNTHGRPLRLYTKQPADFWPALINQEFQILKATCWLVRKRLFLELDGFDTDFEDGYEDTDFCLRVRQRGYKCFYAAESVIYHAMVPVPHTLNQEARDWELFRCKWGVSIVPDIESFYEVPEPVPEIEEVKNCEVVPAAEIEEVSATKKLSHIEERYKHVEALHDTHPLIASILRTIIRFATSTAKLLNRSTR